MNIQQVAKVVELFKKDDPCVADVFKILVFSDDQWIHAVKIIPVPILYGLAVALKPGEDNPMVQEKEEDKLGKTFRRLRHLIMDEIIIRETGIKEEDKE